MKEIKIPKINLTPASNDDIEKIIKTIKGNLEYYNNLKNKSKSQYVQKKAMENIEGMEKFLDKINSETSFKTDIKGNIIQKPTNIPKEYKTK